MNSIFLYKVYRVLKQKINELIGGIYPLDQTLTIMTERPFELFLEFTNVCNANCVFCPYQYQMREKEFMPDSVFFKAIEDYCEIGGGSINLTPIVGDALIHPDFLKRVRYLRAQSNIDRISLTTNGILLDKHGIEEILNSGLTSIFISTSGFDEESYKRIYRSSLYERMRNNILKLVELNSKMNEPVLITIGLRTDRSLDKAMNDKDFQPILKYKPQIDFTWSFTSAGGRITRDILPKGMRLRVVKDRKMICVNLYNGPIVLPDGIVMACSCVAAMDAISDLGIGNIMNERLIDIWHSEKMKEIRESFGTDRLNKTCASCDMYRTPELYKTSEGREKARLNKLRLEGETVFRKEKPKVPFEGG